MFSNISRKTFQSPIPWLAHGLVIAGCMAFALVGQAQITLKTPVAGTVLNRAQVVGLQVAATDGAKEVDFYNGGIKKAAVTNAVDGVFTYQWIVTSASEGTNAWAAQVVNAAGQNTGTSSAVRVTVTIPTNQSPTIVMQPNDCQADQGRSATFKVVADGGGKLAYQWYFNGKAIPGRTEPELKLMGVTTDMNGQYTVKVSSDYGMATSSVAGLKTGQASEAPTGLRVLSITPKP